MYKSLALLNAWALVEVLTNRYHIANVIFQILQGLQTSSFLSPAQTPMPLLVLHAVIFQIPQHFHASCTLVLNTHFVW